MTLSVTALASPKLTVPLPVTSGVTSNSTQVPVATAPTVAVGLPEIAGALFQLSVYSPQGVDVPSRLFETPVIDPPLLLGSVTKSRSFALCTGPESPATTNLRKD